MAARLADRSWLAMLALATSLAVVFGVACSGLLSMRWSLLVVDVSQLCAALTATAACWTTAVRNTGAQRRWRLWMGAGTCGWAIGQLQWSIYHLLGGAVLPPPSAADAAYLLLPVCALVAIIALAAGRPAPSAQWRLGSRLATTALDGFIVTGSLFVLSWVTVLGPVIRAGASSRLAYSIAIAYPVTDLLLTVIIVLLIGMTSSAHRLQLLILGVGLFSLSVSDSVFAYRVSAGAKGMPTLADAGFVIGLSCVALAALTPPGPSSDWEAHPDVRWGRLLLPYVPVAGVVVLSIVQQMQGAPLDAVAIVAETLVIALLITRQAIGLAQAAKLAGSRARLVIASDRSRRRLERDLHDGIQQRLIAIALDVRRAEADVPSGMTGLRQQLSTVVTGLGDAVNEVRELSRGVHPAMLTEGGLKPALRTLARRCDTPVELDVQLDGRAPESVEVAAYYVAAEALTNVTKYAQATVVQVGARVQRGYLQLTVHDDGVGGADPKRGTGLTGLADRVEALGGVLTVDSPPGRGTRLQAQLPMNRA
ncbi:histidine kinase [Dactylosporangium sp. NPDC051485]|uniref:sensor histidine kinase n=1 Tax=Dactylosporangium sp. NPDC051485 TaxID=3154846 RepID=UPI003426CBD2